MKKNQITRVLSTILLLCAVSLKAEVKLPAIISDNMILQQQSNVILWGEANPGRTVTVTTSWDGQKYTTQADKKTGKWQLNAQTPKAGGPYEIIFSDGKPVTVKNILIGEVWLCSGQANMEMPMRGYRSQPVEGSQELLIKASPDTPIRAFSVKKKISRIPEENCAGEWVENTANDMSWISATGYMFAQYLQEVLQVPVGIIVSAWGGTIIQAWMSPESLQTFPSQDLSHLSNNSELKKANLGSVLYLGMLYPLRNYRIKGAIWYQGESNRLKAKLYEQLFPAFVKSLRKLWNQGDFPFYYTQIAPYNYEGADSISSALLREAQMHCLNTIPNSGMAVTLDIGAPRCIHPCQKKEVGHRLAYWALAKDYGKTIFAYQGPRYKSMEVKKGVAHLTFDQVSDGLAPIETELDYFEIAGADRKFYPAKAKLNYNTQKIEVKSDSVPEPVAVRYAFKNYVKGTLFDNFGLPASSFRTDNW